MINKRFSTNGYYIYDNYHNGVKWLVNEVEVDEIVDMMNNLDLKSRGISKALSKLEKENEQLKSVINEVTELLSDEVDLFSDKSIEHDINAYIELKELDNKDAFYMAKATKTAIKMLNGVLDD